MVGARLKLARKKAGLSLRDLAHAIGGLVSAQALSKYERDEMVRLLDCGVDGVITNHPERLQDLLVERG